MYYYAGSLCWLGWSVFSGPAQRVSGLSHTYFRSPFGRKSKLTPQQCAELRNRRAQGVLIRELMEDYKLSKASVYRYLKDTEDARA